MPIFTNQLGSLRDLTPQESVSAIANHIRSLQEQLEYRLANLDSTNITEINADETSILTGGEEINNVLTGASGELSSLKQSVNGLRMQVQGTDGAISELTQTSIGLQSQVSSLTGDVSTLTQTSMGLSSQVSSLDGSVSSLTQTVAGMSLSVSNGSDSSTISLMQNGVAISSKTVQITGMVTFSDLSRSGGTTINGANITTGSINASLITTGTLSSNYIRLYDSMAVYSGSSIAGYIGYTTSANDGSSGVHLKNGLGEVVATSSGAKLTYNGTTNQIYIGNGNAGVTVSGVSYMFQTGAFRPITSGGPMLGTSAALWGQIYSTNSAVSTSDRNKKNTIEDLDERYLALIERVRCRRFKFNDGTSDRFHPGFVSQDVEEDLAAVGLDSQEFGGFVKDKDEDGNDIYFLRYEEFIAPLVAKVQEMDKRLKKLEVSA